MGEGVVQAVMGCIGFGGLRLLTVASGRRRRLRSAGHGGSTSGLRHRTIALIFCAFGLWAACGPALAQAPPVPSRQVFYSDVKPLADTIEQTQSDPRPKNTDGAIQALDWLIFGNVTGGGVYDSNVLASPTQQGVYGMRFVPSVVAERNTGIERTFVYGTGDIRYYPSLGRTDLYGSNVGVLHVWEIERDLIFRAQVDVGRSQESSALVTSGTYYVNPVNYTSLFASTSLEKRFGNFFTAIGGSVTSNIYDNTTDSLGNTIDETFQNGTRATLNDRFGYHISPIIYVFVEPSVNAGKYQNSNLNSNGYQVIAGLGSARISLFTGEIYGGVLQESFNDPLTPNLTWPIFGGKLSWYPTRFVTFTGSVDQTLGTSDFSPTVFTTGSVTKIDTEKFLASWAIRRNITLEGSVQYQSYGYLSSSRVDDLWQFDFKPTYYITEKFGISFDYTYIKLSSNTPGVAYNRSLVSLGATSKF